ncbi:MAG TPA: ATPase, partial [Erythrobacter sp.]|nr:ATPase [Erythrobacter sp.]
MRVIGPKPTEEAPDSGVESSSEEAIESPTNSLDEDLDIDFVRSSRTAWIVPAIAILAIMGWSGFYGWAMQTKILQGGTAQQWIGWITQWSTPVLLISVSWLLAMRNSRCEAK